MITLKSIIQESKIKKTLTETSDYRVYHNSYTSAVEDAIKFAERKGYVVDEDDIWSKISTGPKKPKDGKTNKFSVTLIKNGKIQKKALQIQITGLDRKYELNVYIN